MPYRALLLKQPSKITTYVGLDILEDRYAPPDMYWNAKSMPMRNETVDSAMATEVLEHCPYPDKVLEEVHRVLKPGGLFFFTIPFLWPLHDVPYDEYRYTPFALKRLFSEAGFSSVELFALGGWNASLAQLIGLWVRRSPMSSNKRKVLSTLAVPIVSYLANRDVKPSVFSESTMITGLAGIARK
jgi:SAM-dependent methyltransferase